MIFSFIDDLFEVVFKLSSKMREKEEQKEKTDHGYT
jgi:hypothetical protein